MSGPSGKPMCPACCRVESKVRDSRGTPFGVRRRRECKGCSHRWSTLEVTLPEIGEGTSAVAQAIRLIEAGKWLLLEWEEKYAKQGQRRYAKRLRAHKYQDSNSRPSYEDVGLQPEED